MIRSNSIFTMLGFAAAGFLAVSVAGAADSRSAIGAPSLSVGDSWTYRLHDGFTKIDQGTFHHVIRDISNGRVTLEITRRDRAGSEIEIYDREWNWLKRPATNLETFEYTPAYRAFDFPLSPGKTWRAYGTAFDRELGKRYPVRIDGRVMGWERIRVPAGEFDALKVRRVVYIGKHIPMERDQAEILEFDWYAPAVGQVVRREGTSQHLNYIYGDFGTPVYIDDGWTVAELVSYTRGK
jgi:hypothetical protein